VIGEGISANTLERIGVGVKAGSVGEDLVADGQIADFKFRMVTSQQSLEDELKIGVGIDARYGLFSGGARFDFAQSNSVNTKSTFILASCTVKNALRFGSDFRPTDIAAPLIAAGDQDGFETAFGTRFVQALRTGGELYVLVRVTSSTMEHQSRIGASLHAELNGLVAAGAFQAAFDTARQDSSSHTEVDIAAHQVGGQGAQIQFVGADADKIKAQMNVFAAAVHENAVAYEAELLTYDALALPFPSRDELDDKRRILEDCLRRKQRYWSILSDLRLAQEPAATEYFSDLPPPEVLMELTIRFQTVLNDLMAHARAVANGSIPPSLFVTTEEPPPPVLKRRSSTSFGLWWSRRNDPALLRDERLIVHRVGDEAGKNLTVSLLDAAPEVVERASRFIDRLDLGSSDLESMEKLPKILDAPLRRLSAGFSRVETLKGLEAYPSLEHLGFNGCRLRDLAAITGLGGLQSLNVADNRLTDLSPITGLTMLDSLHLGGNQISSLEPLRGLKRINALSLAGGRPEQFVDDVSVRPFKFLDNPINDARPVQDLPLLDNLLTRADRLTIELLGLNDLAVRTRGEARRAELSNRFDLAPEGGGAALTLILSTFAGITEATRRLVLISAFIPSLTEVAFTFADPEDLSATLPAAESKARLEAELGLGFLVAILMGLEPTLIIEARAGAA
jgi:hypothetical protein